MLVLVIVLQSLNKYRQPFLPVGHNISVSRSVNSAGVPILKAEEPCMNKPSHHDISVWSQTGLALAGER